MYAILLLMNKSTSNVVEGEVLQSPYVSRNNDTTQDNSNNVKNPRKVKLSYKANQFIKNYKEGNTMGNGTKSAIKAGYSEVSASSYASQLLKNPKVLSILNESVEEAERTINDLMYDDSPAIRLASAKEVLDRTIGKPIQRSESLHVNVTVESMLNDPDD